MELKKYRKPHMSEALMEIATLVGCTKVTESDALSRKSLEQTSDEDLNNAEKSSLFSKFSVSKRPAGFFGTQPGDVHNHTGEINVTVEKSAAFHSPKRPYRDDTIEKSDQKELANRSANISPALTESNLSKFTQKRHSGNFRNNPQNLDVIHERISGERILKPAEIKPFKASPKPR